MRIGHIRAMQFDTEVRFDTLITLPQSPKAARTTGQFEAIPVNMEPAHVRIPFGAEFTIAGIKIIGPGRFTTGCKPGEETVLVNSRRESVFKLRGNDVS